MHFELDCLGKNKVGNSSFHTKGEYRRVLHVPRNLKGSFSTSSEGFTGEISVDLPRGVYFSCLMRELTKSDVTSNDFIDSADMRKISNPTATIQGDHRIKKRTMPIPSWSVQKALIHQKIFRSGGMRSSLLPSNRGFDDVWKNVRSY